MGSMKEKAQCVLWYHETKSPVTVQSPRLTSFYGVTWKNILQPAGHRTIWRMRIACGLPKATNAHWGYVILIAFPVQQWLHERAWMLRYTYKIVLFISVPPCFTFCFFSFPCYLFSFFCIPLFLNSCFLLYHSSRVWHLTQLAGLWTVQPSTGGSIPSKGRIFSKATRPASGPIQILRIMRWPGNTVSSQPLTL